MQQQRVTTLLSDFGLKDVYVAEMKATILGLCSHVQIVDVSHNVEKFDIHMGAFLLASAAPHLPDETVHVAVVDPGVGTKRKPKSRLLRDFGEPRRCGEAVCGEAGRPHRHLAAPVSHVWTWSVFERS